MFKKSASKKAPLPPSDQRFAPCAEAKEIAHTLITSYPEKFGEIVTAHILYLTKVGGIVLRGEQKAGKIGKLTGQKKFLSRSVENNNEGWDFVVTLSAEFWGLAGPRLKERVVFHELKHTLKTEKDDGSTEFKIVPHDIETFIDETELYGSGRDLADALVSVTNLKNE
jgi:hypothetical protein